MRMFGLFAFILIILLGASQIFAMEMNEDGNMDGCPFTGKTMLCKMNILEHLSLWQSMFTVIPKKSVVLLVLISVLTAVILFNRSVLTRLLIRKQESQLLYFLQHSGLYFLNIIQEIFSQGILHPKIYNPATF